MRSHVFLTPMSPDGKPGEVVEVQYNNEAPRQFLAPVSPWAVNEKQLGDLRTAVTQAETALRHAKSRRAGEAEVTRLEKALTAAERELATVEFELRLKRQREQTGADSPFARQTVAEAVAAAVAVVAALPTHAAAAVQKTTVPWDTFLRELDAKLAKRATLPRLRGETTAPAAAVPPHGARPCCVGPYQCAACRAKAAA